MYKQNRVSRAIWPWMTNSPEKKHSASLTSISVSLVIGGIATCLFLYFGHVLLACFVGSFSLFLFCSALWLPAIYAKILFFFTKFSTFIGQFLNWVLLVPFFYLVFPVGRLCQKLRSKDPLCRDLDSSLSTYWIERESVEQKEQYKRQF